MSKRNLTYLQIPLPAKRRAQMASAGLGVSLSDYVTGLITADAARLGIGSLPLFDDLDQEAMTDDQEVSHE